MRIHLRDSLPYVTASLVHQGRQMSLRNVLLDTDSAGSVFSIDKVLTVGLTYEPHDEIHRIRGVGGAEFVFTKRVDHLAVGDLQVSGFPIEVGTMDYGFEIDGIIGMDFLARVGAVIDLAELEMYPGVR